jgi:hypothetical protein
MSATFFMALHLGGARNGWTSLNKPKQSWKTLQNPNFSLSH